MKNIDIYYESIKLVNEQIKNWKAPKQPFRERFVDVILVVAVIIFLSSIIPILPFLYVIIGGYLNWSFFTIFLDNTTMLDFGKIWAGFALVGSAFALLINWINNKVDAIEGEPTRPPQSLSPEQLTFIAVYESYKELKIFFVSHVEQHVDNSLNALNGILPHFFKSDDDLAYEEYQRQFQREELMRERYLPRSPWGTANFINQVIVAESFLNTFEKYDWFQLDTQTKFTLTAIISFSEKIPLRLKDKQDLPRILSILENLSKFTYAYLPEHNTYMEDSTLNELHSDGAKCLNKFVHEINELTPYKREEKSKGKHEIAPTIIEKIKGKFYENVFFRFAVWFLLISALTSGTVVAINQQLPLSPDAMVTLIIGTSVASAAGLAGFLPVKSK